MLKRRSIFAKVGRLNIVGTFIGAVCTGNKYYYYYHYYYYYYYYKKKWYYVVLVVVVGVLVDNNLRI